MSLESGSYINDLVITNPTSSDPKSQGDDHFQLIKKVLKECLNGFTGGILLTATESGTASAHVLTPTTALVGYTTGLMLLYRPTNAGTGALTVNVSALGAKSVKTIAGADPTSGDILANQPVLLMYDGTNFVILAGSEYLSKTGNQTLTGDLTLTGNQTVGGTLGVTGASTFVGDIGGAGGDKKANLASPTFTGTVTLPADTSIDAVSGTEISYLNGVTGAIQTQIDAKAPIESPIFTGTVTIPSGASIVGFAPLASPALTGTPTAPTAATGTSTTQIASTEFVAATAFAAVLPAQTGNAGKFITTDGTTARWAHVAAGAAIFTALNFSAL